MLAQGESTTLSQLYMTGRTIDSAKLYEEFEIPSKVGTSIGYDGYLAVVTLQMDSPFHARILTVS